MEGTVYFGSQFGGAVPRDGDMTLCGLRCLVAWHLGQEAGIMNTGAQLTFAFALFKFSLGLHPTV